LQTLEWNQIIHFVSPNFPNLNLELASQTPDGLPWFPQNPALCGNLGFS
jgi:hypothetical protein